MGIKGYLCIITENSPNDYIEINDTSIYTCSSIIRAYAEIEDISGLVMSIHTPQIQFPLNENDNVIDLFPYLLTNDCQSSFIRPEFYLYLSTKEEDKNSIVLYVKLNQKINGESIESQFKLPSDILTKTVKEFRTEMQNYITDDIVIENVLINDKIVEESVKVDSFFRFQNQQHPNISININFDQKAIKRVNYRAVLIHEIIKTEGQYIQNLRYLSEIWSPNLKSKRVLNDQEFDLIFKDIDSIIECHQQFLESLRKSDAGYCSCISPAFIEFSNRFHISFSYISSYSQIIELLDKKNQNRTFLQAIKDISKLNNDNDLQSLLIKPVQRIPQYPLFIERLMKCTPKTHLDYDLISYANEKVNETSNNANMYSDQFNRQTILIQLHNKFRNSSFRIYQPSRKLILYEKLTMIKYKKKYQVTIYVCNDVIFIVKESKLFPKVVFACPSYRFHYISVAGQFRSIHVKYIKSAQKSIGFELIFPNLHDKTTFFETIQQIEDEIISILRQQKLAIWRMDSISESIPEVCQHSAVSNANSIVFSGGTFEVNQKMVNSNFFTYNRDKVHGDYFSQVTSCEMGTIGRRRHTMNYLNNGFIVIGGIGKEKEVETIEKFQVHSKNWVVVLPKFPISRFDHTTVYYNDDLWVFGGKSKRYKDIPLFLKVNEHSGQIIKTSTKEPCGRSGHSAVVYKNKMYIFGGSSQSKSLLNDLWSYDFDLNIWTCEKVRNDQIVKPRTHHMSFVIGKQMFIVGGVTSSIVSPTICIDLDEMEASTVTDIGNFPQAIEFSAGGIINDNSTIILYGGIEQQSNNPTSHIYIVTVDSSAQIRNESSIESISLNDSKTLNPKSVSIDSSDTYDSEKYSKGTKDSENQEPKLNVFENDGWKSFLESTPHDSQISYKTTYQPLKRTKSQSIFRKRASTLVPIHPNSVLNTSLDDRNVDASTNYQTSVKLAMCGITEQSICEQENDNHNVFYDDADMSESPPKSKKLRQSLFVMNALSHVMDMPSECEQVGSESASFSNILSNQSDLSTEASDFIEENVINRNVQLDIEAGTEFSFNTNEGDQKQKNQQSNHVELIIDSNNKTYEKKLKIIHDDSNNEQSRDGFLNSNNKSMQRISKLCNASPHKTKNNELVSSIMKKNESAIDIEISDDETEISADQVKVKHRHGSFLQNRSQTSDDVKHKHSKNGSLCRSDRHFEECTKKPNRIEEDSFEDDEISRQEDVLRGFEQLDPVFRIMHKINNASKHTKDSNLSNGNSIETISQGSSRYHRFPWKKRDMSLTVTSNKSPPKQKGRKRISYTPRKITKKKNAEDEMAGASMVEKELNTSRKKYTIAYLPMPFNKTNPFTSDRMNLSDLYDEIPLESGSPKHHKK